MHRTPEKSYHSSLAGGQPSTQRTQRNRPYCVFYNGFKIRVRVDGIKSSFPVLVYGKALHKDTKKRLKCKGKLIYFGNSIEDDPNAAGIQEKGATMSGILSAPSSTQ